MMTRVVIPAFFLIVIFLAGIYAGLDTISIVVGLVFGFLVGKIFS